ncbi:hypothetical protein HAX54_024873 [Datura stramonium]|uniref:Uncharacterized protein n=1 Tax=Datura stramonium TaxID=4076 RepID=A0ABS8UYS9_DATST|nr:hypothetical protein [Datura stramonium]
MILFKDDNQLKDRQVFDVPSSLSSLYRLSYDILKGNSHLVVGVLFELSLFICDSGKSEYPSIMNEIFWHDGVNDDPSLNRQTIAVMTKMTARCPFDGSSYSPSSFRFGTNIHMSQVLKAPKLQTIRGGSQRRNARDGNPHQLWDEATDSENKVQDVGPEETTPSYLTRSNPQSDKGDKSSENGSSLDGFIFESDEESGSDATISPEEKTTHEG